MTGFTKVEAAIGESPRADCSGSSMRRTARSDGLRKLEALLRRNDEPEFRRNPRDPGVFAGRNWIWHWAGQM